MTDSYSNLTDPQPLKLMTLVEPHACSYLPGKQSNSIFIDSKTRPTWAQYSQLSRAGFRRSGGHFYRPNCPDCNACQSSRVSVRNFTLSRRFKRVLKRNGDLTVQLVSAGYSDEHYRLFERYIDARHRDGDMYPATEQQFRDFLCSEDSYAHFIEFRLGGDLIACAVVDLLDDGVSAIYTYYCPQQESRSLGVLAVLWQISYARQTNLPFVYLGYWIEECAKMRYKDQYQPLEVFNGDNWHPLTTKKPKQN